MKIQNLPEEIKTLALLRQKQCTHSDFKDKDIIKDLVGGFCWENTPEGGGFWDQIDDGNFDPFYKLYPKEVKIVNTVTWNYIPPMNEGNQDRMDVYDETFESANIESEYIVKITEHPREGNNPYYNIHYTSGEVFSVFNPHTASYLNKPK